MHKGIQPKIFCIALGIFLGLSPVSADAAQIDTEPEEVWEQSASPEEEINHTDTENTAEDSSLLSSEGDVPLDAGNFPDEAFRSYLSEEFDLDKDGLLSASERKAVTHIYISNPACESIQGVEHFTSLRNLLCYSKHLTSLDVSQNINLLRLDCPSSQLTNLDVSHNTALTWLDCSSNQLDSLDLSHNTALKRLSCDSNHLSALDLSQNIALEELYCDRNQLSSLDLGGNSSLKKIYCRFNPLSALNLNSSSLTELRCENNQLTVLNVGNAPALTYLSCYSNQLSSLDLSGVAALEYLACENNKLNSLSLGQASSLKTLNCQSNQLNSLDIGEAAQLENLSCGSNQLSSLDVSALTSLKNFACSSNQLSSLDLSNSERLQFLSCQDNRLTVLNVGKAFELSELDCTNNQLVSLDLGSAISLERLECQSNQLKSLNVDNTPSLTYLNCDQNRLISLNLDGAAALTYLSCQKNLLTTLDIGKNTKLEKLFCALNERMRSLNTRGAAALKLMSSAGNPIGCLDFSENPSLTEIYPSGIICVGGRQIDMCKYDSTFDPDRVTSLLFLELNNGVFTITGSERGIYTYDCGRGFAMMVVLETKAAEDPADDTFFADVPVTPGNWKYENIKFVSEKGIMTGVNETEFQPDQPLTRAQFASVIYRLAGSPTVTYQDVFTDVSAGKWYSDAIVWAYENQIVAGLGNGRYGINDNITREQMARMLMEFAKVQNYDVSDTADFNKFADASQVSGWAVNNMRWAVGSGIITGSVSNNNYYMNPKGNATRAECAVMLTKFIQKYQ